MPPDFLIIANPVSGSRAAPEAASRVKELLEQTGAAARLELTAARGDAFQIAARAAEAGTGAIVGCGGDGTLQEIASAIEGTQSRFGILPYGRCNDFAHALGLRRSDPVERLANVLIEGHVRQVDLGAFGEKRFLTVATLGFDSDVSRFVETRDLWIKGTASYLYGVLRILTKFKPPLVKIRGDFGLFEGRILLAATGNSPCYGGAMEIAPGARIDDGLFHICVIEEVPKRAVLQMLPRVMKGTHLPHPAVRLLQSKSLDIETPEGPQWICADGETLGQTPARFEVRPGALTVLCPAAP